MSDPVAVLAIPEASLHHEELGFWRTYLFSTDHKTIGKQYLSLGLFMAIVGGFLAYVMRWQLAYPDTEVPGWGFVGPEFYNVLVTMHGTFMVFFAIMPLLVGVFANFLIPLKIGAPDMAFPRLNMWSFWLMIPAGAIMFCAPKVLVHEAGFADVAVPLPRDTSLNSARWGAYKATLRASQEA